MPRNKNTDNGRPIASYEHAGKERLNNPPIGLVTPETDPDAGKQIYQYDPHLDPQLVWAGKAEHTSFEVPRSRCTSTSASTRAPSSKRCAVRPTRTRPRSFRCSTPRSKTRPCATPSTSTAIRMAGATALWPAIACW